MIFEINSIILGKFKIEELIERGAFVDVYRIRHIELLTNFVLKVLKKDLLQIESTVFNNIKQKFELEAHIGTLIEHPNVLRVTDLVKVDDYYLLIMEYAPNHTLAYHFRNAQKRKETLGLGDALRIALDVARGLSAVHSYNIVHSNITPSTIMFNEEGKAKLSDFSSAHILGDLNSQFTLTMSHSDINEYMSPEQKSRKKVNLASDIYSIGAIIYEMLFQELFSPSITLLPQIRESISILARQARILGKFSQKLEDLLVVTLSHDPKDRFINGKALVDALEELIPEIGNIKSSGSYTIWNKSLQIEESTVIRVDSLSPTSSLSEALEQQKIALPKKDLSTNQLVVPFDSQIISMPALPVNPYIAGTPLQNADHFFGRGPIISWVKKELLNPSVNALVLFGQRRIGKTSLLLRLQDVLPKDTFFPIYFDLQDQATRPLGEVLFDLADAIAEVYPLDSLSADDFDNKGRFFEKTFLPKLYSLLEQKVRPVILFDEFDVLDNAYQKHLPDFVAAKALFPFLRRLIQKDTRLVFVFVVGRRQEDLSLNFLSTFKASLVKEIWTLDNESAIRLIRQAEKNGSLNFGKDAIEYILWLTNNHPYIAQLLCQRIWEQAYAINRKSVPQIGVEQVNLAIADTLAVGSQAFIWVWDGLGPAERIYASAIAEISQYQQGISRDEVIHVLSENALRLRTREVELAPVDLVKRRVLIEKDNLFFFAVELFRQWIKQNKPLKDVKDELDQIDPLANQLFEMGEGFFRRKNFERAKSYFQDTLQANQEHFQARVLLGETLMELGELNLAINELSRTYDMDRQEARYPFARALIKLAYHYIEEGKLEEATSTCEQVLQISPGDREPIEIRRVIWTKQGDQALDKGELKQALILFGQAENQEKVDKVKFQLKLLELAPIEKEALQTTISKNWERAIQLYEKLVLEAPSNDYKYKWQVSLRRFQENFQLSYTFDFGIASLVRGEWKEAQLAFRWIIMHRANFRKNDYNAPDLLKMALNKNNNSIKLSDSPVNSIPKNQPLPKWLIEDSDTLYSNLLELLTELEFQLKEGNLLQLNQILEDILEYGNIGEEELIEFFVNNLEDNILLEKEILMLKNTKDVRAFNKKLTNRLLSEKFESGIKLPANLNNFEAEFQLLARKIASDLEEE